MSNPKKKRKSSKIGRQSEFEYEEGMELMLLQLLDRENDLLQDFFLPLATLSSEQKAALVCLHGFKRSKTMRKFGNDRCSSAVNYLVICNAVDDPLTEFFMEYIPCGCAKTESDFDDIEKGFNAARRKAKSIVELGAWKKYKFSLGSQSIPEGCVMKGRCVMVMDY